MKILVVDYGMGNLKSVLSAIKYVGYNNIKISNDISDIKTADKLILPGVGNFASAVKKIEELELVPHVREQVLGNKKPILGICLGMQLLGMSSSESGFNSGFGLVDGLVEKFSLNGLKIPHVGYNQVNINKKGKLYTGLQAKPDFYFTHNYRMHSNSDIGQSECSYGEPFIASFEVENIVGTQFHPELSQKNGLRLIQNFLELF